jgi:hypothetical protein
MLMSKPVLCVSISSSGSISASGFEGLEMQSQRNGAMNPMLILGYGYASVFAVDAMGAMYDAGRYHQD